MTLTAPPEQPASRPPVSQRFRLRATPARRMPDPEEYTAPPSPDKHAGSDVSTSWIYLVSGLRQQLLCLVSIVLASVRGIYISEEKRRACVLFR